MSSERNDSSFYMVIRISGHHTKGLVAYPELRLESFEFSIKAAHTLLRSGSFYGALNHCAVMWDQLAVDEVEYILVREISVLAIEQLRLIWENFTRPSESIRRRNMSDKILGNDEVMRYERLAMAISETMTRIIQAGGGKFPKRQEGSWQHLNDFRPVSASAPSYIEKGGRVLSAIKSIGNAFFSVRTVLFLCVLAFILGVFSSADLTLFDYVW